MHVSSDDMPAAITRNEKTRERSTAAIVGTLAAFVIAPITALVTVPALSLGAAGIAVSKLRAAGFDKEIQDALVD